MAGLPSDHLPPEQATVWRKDRKLRKQGFADLQYMPPGRCEWNATLAALAFSARQRIAGEADLNLWAAMHACAPSARYEQLGRDGLTIWHGTSALRATKIREVGLFSKRGVWGATDPVVSHGYTRWRSRIGQAGAAMIVFVVSKDEWDSRATPETEVIARFHERIPPECIEYIIWPDRVEFVGAERARSPRPWAAAPFKRSGGKWVPRSRPPVRFDGGRDYSSLKEWLDLSVVRVLETLGVAAGIELFASLYATIHPWEALPHRDVFDALDRLARPGSNLPGGISSFVLAQRPRAT